MIRSNPNYSFKLSRLDWQYGVHRIRKASIIEPNPDAGKIGGSGDQEYIIGKLHSKPNYSFRAKTSKQALDLLERTCFGEKDLGDTVQESWGGKQKIHGFSKPQGGIDNWIYAGFNLEVKQEEGVLVSKLGAYEFETGNVLISKSAVKTVGDIIWLYEANPISFGVLKSLKRGIFLENRMRKHLRCESPEEYFYEKTGGLLASNFMEDYFSDLKSLEPFDISKKAKDALLFGMMIDKLYVVPKREED